MGTYQDLGAAAAVEEDLQQAIDAADSGTYSQYDADAQGVVGSMVRDDILDRIRKRYMYREMVAGYMQNMG